jgi:hypothetical protein
MTNRHERLDQLIAEHPGWTGETVATLRRLIHEADPELEETWKWVTPRRPGTPVFEHDGIVGHINILKERVRLTLTEGASLPDPRGLWNAALAGNHQRAIDIGEDDPIDEDGIRDLVRAAVREHLARRAERPPRRG